MTPTETIAALATPPGRGGVGIIRVSGPGSAEIASCVLGHCPTPRHAQYLSFRSGDGSVIDQGIALFFPGPHSFTGEDVLELQGHGGPLVMDLLLRAVLAVGARPARPGEFSERAFLNGKIDLAQAEAIADLIESASEEAAQAALRSLQGAFSGEIQRLLDQLIELRMYVESAIDFSEDEVDFLSEGGVSERLQGLNRQVERIQSTAKQGVLLREGMSIVIAGRPNAGKSSLLNALSGRPTAIVTDIPGTTRDVLREAIAIDGLPLRIVDTAGLRDSDDPVEREGIRRAWEEISRADRILLVIDGTKGFGEEEEAILAKLPPALPVTVVSNKIDLLGTPPALTTVAGRPEITVSAQTGEGLELLRSHLKELMGYRGGGGGLFSARRRHLDALKAASRNLERASEQLALYNAGELVAEELRLAQQEISSITGAFTADDLLGRIFASFCIGK